MRAFSARALLAIVVSVAAIPITPSAPEHQLLAEQMRSEGLSEHDIAERLSTPLDTALKSGPFFAQISGRVHSLLHSPSDEIKRDVSGDIAPGSLESPQMLPRAAVPDTFTDTVARCLAAFFRGEEIEKQNFGYEGKELEMRRPEGMRHWG
ncbi:hypothetical protein P154DRAFT_619277 [Amniculicola lignicola CBS 123094]|uniref:Uncharacterized protein n=1 Tax=Amniculicola lignicola CBS 123094 TaxID=1392246 RepID=A0A6A5WLH5_9PLEO|nr:hypothetical protein P154DRAFT_619277 [Amniculicola lignicola CBS 123094]